MRQDALSNREQHADLNPAIQQALQWLDGTDLESLELGRHVIDGDRLFAIAERYTPKSLDQSVWETHRRYMDVQYILAGEECMGWLERNDQLPIKTPYDADRDAMFYEDLRDQATFLPAPAGQFLLFWPNDVHAPGLGPMLPKSNAFAQVTDPGIVRKVVVKVLLDN